MVSDLIDQTTLRLNELRPSSINDIRAQRVPIVGFSNEVHEKHMNLKFLLNKHLYHHQKVLSMVDEAKGIIEVLFDRYMSNPEKMPSEFSDRARIHDKYQTRKARVVADYIAGMTDRFAIAEHERLS